MSFKVVQMIVRGFILMLMTLGLFYNSECKDLTSANHFIMTGVYGSFIFVTLGLIIEAGLEIYTDEFIESTFIALGMVLNGVNTALAFYEYYAKVSPIKETMNKAFVSMTSLVIYFIDLLILRCKR